MTNPDPQASAQAGTERLQEWFGQTLPDLQAKATSEEAANGLNQSVQDNDTILPPKGRSRRNSESNDSKESENE